MKNNTTLLKILCLLFLISFNVHRSVGVLGNEEEPREAQSLTLSNEDEIDDLEELVKEAGSLQAPGRGSFDTILASEEAPVFFVDPEDDLNEYDYIVATFLYDDDASPASASSSLESIDEFVDLYELTVLDEKPESRSLASEPGTSVETDTDDLSSDSISVPATASEEATGNDTVQSISAVASFPAQAEGNMEEAEAVPSSESPRRDNETLSREAENSARSLAENEALNRESSSSSSSSSSNTGRTVGIVIGVLASLVVLVAVVYGVFRLWMRMSSKQIGWRRIDMEMSRYRP
eukprot:g4573.t1